MTRLQDSNSCLAYVLCAADMAFRDDCCGICERLEFISCLKAYYVGLNRLNWNDVQVHDMESIQQELAFVTNEVCLSWDLHMSMFILGLLSTTMLVASNAPET